jgi:cadmium resistance protein CadD (predicted permease)
MAWVAVSVLAAAGLRLVPDSWVGLLGVFPLALGLHGLLRARHRDPTYVPATGTISVAVLTIANGVDNVTVYVLHFITLPPSNEAPSIATFFVLLAVWCVAAALIGSHKKISTLVGAAGHHPAHRNLRSPVRNRSSSSSLVACRWPRCLGRRRSDSEDAVADLPPC